jgi:outer membrane protein assembly factor BamA
VQKVSFRGAKYVKEEGLRKITSVRPGMSLNPNLNREGCRKIEEMYKEMGRLHAHCELVKGDNVNDAEVVYAITEGPKVEKDDLQLVGNSCAGQSQTEIRTPARIGQIIVAGNTRTSTESILAHVPLYSGQVLTYPELQQAEKALAELGLFVVDPAKGIRPWITVIDPDGDSAYKDILITVKEKPKAKRTSAEPR